MNACTNNCQQGRTCTCDPARAERQQFLHPPAVVVLTREEFFFWLAVAGIAGALCVALFGLLS